MNKKHEKIEFIIGLSIENAVQELISYREQGKLVCGDFNGTILYSDTVTMDGAYIAITGKTKAEFDEGQKKWREEYDKKEKEHQATIPSLTEEWKQKGRAFVKADKLELWDECVPIRLGDLYHGMELGACEEIITALNNGCTMDEAKGMIENQNHSGMSYGLVCSMVREFADRGKEFADYVK